MTDKIDPLPVPEVEAMVERIAALLYEEATDDPWIIAGIEQPGPDRDYYRGLASKVAALITQHQHQEQAVAWRATREGLRTLVSDATFRRFSPEVQQFYEPYKCASCRNADAAIKALRAEVAEWKRVASAQAGLHDEAEARVKRLEKRLSAYQTAVKKIDDLIEYSLPMPSETKAALYAVLAILTATLAEELTND